MIEAGEASSSAPSSRVRWVQESLNRVLAAGLRPDGRLGPGTVGAIRAFQRRHSLPADGVVGPRTEAALRSALGQPAALAPARPVAGAIRRETVPPQETLYLDIKLGGEGESKPLTGVFIPDRFVARGTVDAILYLHGHRAGHPRLSIDGYWDVRRFRFWPLRESLNASGRNVVLIAPTLGPHSQAGWLVRPGGLDAYLTRVLGDLRQATAFRGVTSSPTLANLILACHSGGGYSMRQLASGSDRAATLIRECWGFDCLYNTGDERHWATWAGGRPGSKLYVYYLGSTQTKSRALAKARVPNITVARSRAPDHNSVPIAHWRERIEGAPFLQPRR